MEYVNGRKEYECVWDRESVWQHHSERVLLEKNRYLIEFQDTSSTINHDHWLISLIVWPTFGTSILVIIVVSVAIEHHIYYYVILEII